METISANSTTWSTIGLYAAAIVVIVLALFGWMVWRKGARVSGEHVFRASRLSHGNRIFPAQVAITNASITLYHPRWIGRLEESIHLAHVASIKIVTHLVFSDVVIESSGGTDPITLHGHTKGDAIAMKALIEGFQTEYYGRKTEMSPPAKA
jgi:hypothetical protein